jgi:hypothetical protein
MYAIAVHREASELDFLEMTMKVTWNGSLNPPGK